MSADWFKEFVFEIVVDKSIVPKDVLDVFNQSPIVLPGNIKKNILNRFFFHFFDLQCVKNELCVYDAIDNPISIIFLLFFFFLTAYDPMGTLASN